ncbi:YbaB/EbfC family nucleoid-associated protein [Candidatus Uhrbacteria bacterium]|nr:YbaB/EbfC family nucleoid-associated protein [Candidatus Uhrbacteria bacterium]
MFNKLKQFKDIRDKAKIIQEALQGETALGSAGWGDKVKVTVNGLQQIVAVSIDADAMNDKTKLENWIKDAANDAMQKVQKVMAHKMKDMGGMDLAKDLQGMLGKGGETSE